MTHRPRVLIVDDSAFARKVVREVLSADPRVEVVGIAPDGADALERIHELRPDVVTLDLVMPVVDGLGVLEASNGPDAPRFVLVTTLDEPSDLVVRALERGAFDFVRKPTSLATDRLYELRDELVAKVLAAAESRAPARGPMRRRPTTLAAPTTRDGRPPEIVVLGASTGGPRAIHTIVSALPADLAVPIAIVLHMPDGYVESYAARLQERSRLRVSTSADGQLLAPGMVVIAVAGQHLRVARGSAGPVLRQAREPAGLHVPSVDELFASAAHAFGRRALGVVLTGMGDDGLQGARAMRAAGGTVWTESPETAVVYGMPRAVVGAGVSDASLALDVIAEALVGACSP